MTSERLPVERRSGDDRRSGIDRRDPVRAARRLPEPNERRNGQERRRRERRHGVTALPPIGS